MGIVVNVKSNANSVAMELRAAGVEMRERAVVSALNKTVQQARTAASREIRAAGYNVKASEIKKALRMARASSGRLFASLIASGRPIPLMAFGARGTRKGVSVNVLNGRKVLDGAFIAKMRNGKTGVFVREGARQKRTKANKWADLPIKHLFGPSIPAAMANAKVQAALVSLMNDKFPQILTQEAKFFSQRSGRSRA